LIGVSGAGKGIVFLRDASLPSSSEEDKHITGEGIRPPEEESDIGDISFAAFFSSLSDFSKSFLSSLGPWFVNN
jgi:hypothetical protein